MSDLPTSGQFLPEAEQLPPSVRSFLMASHRRVIEHCRRLLAAQDLDAEYCDRLNRLAGGAAAQLQRFTG